MRFKAMKKVYLNGQFLAPEEAKISVFDRGFMFGDSVYEVIPFYQGVGFRLDEHLQRLEYSLSELKIPLNVDLKPVLYELVGLNGGKNLSVYIQITRGNPGKRSHVVDAPLEPTVFVCCLPIAAVYQKAPSDVEGIKVIVRDDLRWHRCDIKSTNLLPNILGQQQAKEAHATETLLIRDGLLTEGTSSNLFIVEKGCIITPQVSKEILSGTTRQFVLELAKRHGVPFKEENISYQRLLVADEIWISSSTRAVLPVVEVDIHKVGNGQKGDLWKKMFELFVCHQKALMTGEK